MSAQAVEPIRSPEAVAFAERVNHLAETASLVRVSVDAVAPLLDLIEGAGLQTSCDAVADVVRDTSAVIGHRLAAVWVESEQAQAEAADLGLEIIVDPHATDRREWNHHALARDYVARRLAQREAQGLPAPTLYDVIDWLLEACLPSYWRKDVLRAVGMDRDAYSKSRDERPSGHARKVDDGSDR